MFRSFSFRLCPFRLQERRLVGWLRELNFLWNYSLGQRRDAWRREHRSVSYLDQQARLKHWRAYDAEGLGNLPYVVARDSLQRLDFGYRAAFRRHREGARPLGFPKFRRSTDSFTFVPEGDPFSSGRAGTCRLHVPRLGEVPVRRHRAPPPDGVAKSVTVSRRAEEWQVTIVYKLPDPPAPSPTGPPTAPVGIDLGLTSLATLSTGERIEPPKFFARAEESLAREQRRLARKQRGSHRYERQRLKVARRHAKVFRQRRHFAHQLTHAWAERFDLIAFEDLDAAVLKRGPHLGKGISDAGWGMLRRMAEYKLEERSKRYLEVPSRGTTQECSGCGRTAEPPLTLSEREYRCVGCGWRGGRDHNAARNILDRGMTLLSEELPRNAGDVRRADGRPPPDPRRGRRAYRRRREHRVDWLRVVIREPPGIPQLTRKVNSYERKTPGRAGTTRL